MVRIVNPHERQEIGKIYMYRIPTLLAIIIRQLHVEEMSVWVDSEYHVAKEVNSY